MLNLLTTDKTDEIATYGDPRECAPFRSGATEALESSSEEGGGK